MTSIFDAVLLNKPFILNVYHTVPRENVERFLFVMVKDLLLKVIEEKTQGTKLTQNQIDFIASFYKYSFVGIMLDWIGQGMSEDYHEIVYDMACTLHGSIDLAVKNFTNGVK